MKEITLEQPKEVLKVNVGDRDFSIPLAGSIPFSELVKFRAEVKTDKFNAMMNLLKNHIPEEIFDTLTTDNLKTIMEAWTEASQIDTGVTPGES